MIVSQGAFPSPTYQSVYPIAGQLIVTLVDDEAFGYLKSVIVTPAVYLRLVEFLHVNVQSTGQKSHCVKTLSGHHKALFLLNS